MFCWNVGDWGVQNFIMRGFPRGSRRKGERVKMRDLGMVDSITTSCQFPINDYMVREGLIVRTLRSNVLIYLSKAELSYYIVCPLCSCLNLDATFQTFHSC